MLIIANWIPTGFSHIIKTDIMFYTIHLFHNGPTYNKIGFSYIT